MHSPLFSCSIRVLSRPILAGGMTSLLLAACGEDALVTPPPPPTPCFTPQANVDALTQQVKLTTQPDGLQMGDFSSGCGAPARTGDKVTVQYTGWITATGVQFDTTRKSGGQPFSFSLGKNEVIKGWDEGVPNLRVGGKRRLVIPAALAYGAAGQQGTPIGPNAMLTFDIELLAIG